MEEVVGRKAAGSRGVPKREQEILSRAAKGLTDKEIAADLGISPETVNTYWRRIRARFRAASRTEVVAIAVRNETEQQISDITSEKDALLYEIAERKRVEQELSVSEARWRSLIENSPNLVLTLDTLGRITYGNLPASVAWVDWELRLPALAEEEDRAAVETALTTALDQGISSTVEYRSVLPERERWQSARIAPLPGNDPQACAIAIVYDQTEAHRQLEVLGYANQFLKVITGITATLMGAGPDDLDAAIDSALGSLGAFCSVDTICALVRAEGESVSRATYQWHSGDSPVRRLEPQTFTSEGFPWCSAQLRDLGTVFIQNVASMPEEASTDQTTLLGIGARSVLVVPVARGNEHVGSVGFITYRHPKEWPQDQVALLSMVGEMLGGVLVRRENLRQATRLAEKQREMALAWRSTEAVITYADLWAVTEKALKASIDYDCAVLPGRKGDGPGPEAGSMRRVKESHEPVCVVDANGRWLLGQLAMPGGQLCVVGIGRDRDGEAFRADDIGAFELALESCRLVLPRLQH